MTLKFLLAFLLIAAHAPGSHQCMGQYEEKLIRQSGRALKRSCVAPRSRLPLSFKQVRGLGRVRKQVSESNPLIRFLPVPAD